AANTLGAIAGSFASGFVLVPLLGLLGSLKLCVALNFVISAGLLLICWFTRRRMPVLATALASLVLVIVALTVEPPWDPEVMSSAVYRYAPSLTDKTRQELFEYLRRGQGDTLFYKEGITATVAVQKQGDGRVLKVNGKPEASTSGDMPTQ